MTDTKTLTGRTYAGYKKQKWARFDTAEEAIAAYSERRGECVVWTGPFGGTVGRTKTPVFRYGPYSLGWRQVRTWVDPHRRSRLYSICGNHECVAVAHLTPVATRKYADEWQGTVIDAEKRQKLLAQWRRRVEITKELRTLTLAALGKQYGVTRERIRQIIVDSELASASEIGIGVSDEAIERRESAPAPVAGDSGTSGEPVW